MSGWDFFFPSQLKTCQNAGKQFIFPHGFSCLIKKSSSYQTPALIFFLKPAQKPLSKSPIHCSCFWKWNAIISPINILEMFKAKTEHAHVKVLWRNITPISEVKNERKKRWKILLHKWLTAISKNDFYSSETWLAVSKKVHVKKTNRTSKINFSEDPDLKPDAELETTEFCVPLKVLDVISRNF